MRIKRNEKLSKFAALCKMHAEDAGDRLDKAVERLCRLGFIDKDDRMNYGSELVDVLEDEDYFAAWTVVRDELPRECALTKRRIEALESIEVIGDGDCPECGDKMECEDAEGDYIPGDYDTPPEFIVRREVYRCRWCGHEEKVEIN